MGCITRPAHSLVEKEFHHAAQPIYPVFGSGRWCVDTMLGCHSRTSLNHCLCVRIFVIITVLVLAALPMIKRNRHRKATVGCVIKRGVPHQLRESNGVSQRFPRRWSAVTPVLEPFSFTPLFNQ